MKEARPPDAPARTGFWERWGSLVYALLLVAGIGAVYWPVAGFDFVNLDDQLYVSENQHVHPGITLAGLKWALGTTATANWHPLTWVSHMLDCQVYGPRPGGHHLTSLLLHTANSCLLFAFMLRLTGRRLPSFAVAALFAWHPLHVESVAWVSERKDVLSASFFMLTLWAYTRYAKSLTCHVSGIKFQSSGGGKDEARIADVEGRPNSESRTAGSEVQSSRFEVQGSRFSSSFFHRTSSIFYLLSLCFFALGLMSKPMLVTLPFVLLLLDYWALGRLQGSAPDVRGSTFTARPRALASRPSTLSPQLSTFLTLVFEKAPFFLLSALSCGVTLWAQGRGGAITGLKDLPAAYRIANAVVSYYRYIGKTLWPTHLAAFYPHSMPTLSWEVWLAAAGLVAISIIAWRLKKFPCVAVGWFWFAGMLVPVIGLVQVGGQAMADRYSYLPSIGLFILVVFGVSEVTRRFRFGAGWVAALTVLALGGCLAATQRQVRYWRNSEALFRHAIKVTQGNFVAYNNLGDALFLHGQTAEALDCFTEAVRWQPTYADAHCSRGIALGALKRRAEARDAFRVALQFGPKVPRTHYFWGNALLAEGDAAGAEQEYQTTLALKPDHPEAHYQLALVLLERNQVAEGNRHLHEAIRLRPEWVEALNNLAWLLATQPDARFRDGKEAVQLATQAVTLTQSNQPIALDTLAEALAEAGRIPDAIKTVQSALRLIPASATNELRREIEGHLHCYERGQPVRESSEHGAKAAQGK